MAICTGSKYTQSIQRTECIGNSLPKINSNFVNLDTAVCEAENDIVDLGVRIDTVETELAELKDYVDAADASLLTTIRSRPIALSMDIRGLDVISTGTNSVVSLLNVMAPPGNYEVGTIAKVLGTSQNFTATAVYTTYRSIGRTSTSLTGINSTVSSPTLRQLVYQVRSDGITWEYVSG